MPLMMQEAPRHGAIIPMTEAEWWGEIAAYHEYLEVMDNTHEARRSMVERRRIRA